MAGWTPLFAKITSSSIWDESHHVRLAWIAILAGAGKDGICPVKTVKGLGALARLSDEEAREAMEVLSGPDRNSTGQENDGRRIELVPDEGLRVLNWEKYRKQAQSVATRESNRLAREKYRQKQKAEANGEYIPAEPTEDTEQNESWTGRPAR